MRTPAPSAVLSSILAFALLQPVSGLAQSPDGPQTPAVATPTAAQTTPPPPQYAENSMMGPSSKFVLLDGTPIKLRLSRNASSESATVGESVDFEVLEEVMIDGVVVVPKGGTAIATVTEAVPKRRMGRAGKLELVLDYVRLADKGKAAVRAVKDAKGGSHTVGMTVGIVATGLLFWPAAPFFLFMHGKDITIPKGAEITPYVNGDQRLVAANFLPEGDSFIPLSAPSAIAPAPAQASTQNPILASYDIQSDPSSAEVYVDSSYVGNTPATLKLKFGQPTVRAALPGYKDWSRDLTVQEGSEAHLKATLDKAK
jgi:hypothetical protein